MGRKGPSSGRRGLAKEKKDPELFSESDDEQIIDDAFAQGKGKVKLGGGGEDSEEIDEEAVYDLSDSDEEYGSEEDDEEDEDDGEPDLDLEIERGGRAGRLAKQAKYLEERLKLQQKEDEDEGPSDGEGAEEEARERLWGTSKGAYYGGDDAEAVSDEEDALKGEEEEAVRLQAQRAARLDDDDYGLGDDVMGGGAGAGAAAEGEAEEGEEGAEAAARRGRRGRGVEVEAVERDLSALGAEERMSALLADAPELTSLLAELQASLAEARHRVGPLLREVREGGLATPEGLAYLEAKQLCLLQYAACITAYLLLKAEGRSVRNHPVIGRLVQLRSHLERLGPIDRRLAHQADKLLRATRHVRASGIGSVGGGVGGGGAGGKGQGAEGAGRGKEEEEEERAEQARREEEQQREREAAAKKRKAKRRSSLAKRLAAGDGPGAAPATPASAAAALAARQRAEAMRGDEEEDGGGAVALSRQDAKRLKAQRRAGLARGLLDEFADDVAPSGQQQQQQQQQGGAAANGGLAGLFGAQRLSQKFGADLTQQLRAAGGRGGDDDLPAREPLHERRAKYDAVAARRAAAGGGDDGMEEDGFDYEAAAAGGRKRRNAAGDGEGDGGDEFFRAAKAARAAAKADRRARHEVPALAPPLPDESREGQRPISYAIQKNRGLTPHRRKDLKNPRKKHRIKFAAAQVRRKGQVQGVREAPGAGYSGEATGVKANVAKSRRLG